MRHFFTRETILDSKEAIDSIRKNALPLNNQQDLKPLMKRIGDSRIVMLGEASHGTHEYYTWRAAISKKLIEEKGFTCIAVEGDWPDCYRVNEFIKGHDSENKTVFNVLHEFNRWPTWMWANWEVVALTDWLQKHNLKPTTKNKIGFYGLDVYSLWESMDAIIAYLKKNDLNTLTLAEEAFRCFEPYRKGEGQAYARALQLVPKSCEKEVVDLLKGLQKRIPKYNASYEDVFSTEQNARVAVNAEKYYRTMLKGGPHSWNIRDKHMADTLDRLLEFHGPNSKIIVWEHNTHIGDARATDMLIEGMYNIGELARIRHHEKGVVLVGFGSYKGSVTASKSWGATMQKMQLPEAQKDSWEYLLHLAGKENKLLLMDDFMNDDNLMENQIGHRAVGVVYHPEHERNGNYVPTTLPLRYDAFIYIDETKALHPLHIQPDGNQIPETYPFGV
jgi:erythromycin esterase